MYVRHWGFTRKWASMIFLLTSPWYIHTHTAITPQICYKINNNLSYKRKKKLSPNIIKRDSVKDGMKEKRAKTKKFFMTSTINFQPLFAFLLFTHCHSQLFHSISSHVNTEKAIKAIHEKPELNTTKILKYPMGKWVFIHFI